MDIFNCIVSQDGKSTDGPGEQIAIKKVSYSTLYFVQTILIHCQRSSIIFQLVNDMCNCLFL